MPPSFARSHLEFDHRSEIERSLRSASSTRILFEAPRHDQNVVLASSEWRSWALLKSPVARCS